MMFKIDGPLVERAPIVDPALRASRPWAESTASIFAVDAAAAILQMSGPSRR
jgi:hypothetical protein